MSTDATAVPTQERAPQGLSPPDSNPAMKDTGSDSELSDLEPDPPSKSKEPLKIEPDHVSEGGVPVFKPTMEEFADFERYMDAVNPYGMRSGIVKVIPPPEWVAAQPRLDEVVKTIRVKEPIMQDIMGTGGTYRQVNFTHSRSYNLPQWRQLCNQSEHQPPAKRGERRANQEKVVKSARPPPKPKAPNAPSTSGSQKRSRGRPFKNKQRAATVDTEAEGTPDRLPTPVSPSIKPEASDTPVKLELKDEEDTPSKPKGGRQPKAVSVSSRRKNNRRETGYVDEAAFKDFNYELEGEEYTKERTDELERAYWKTLTYAAPLYGADMVGTLFDDRTTTWNLGKLDNILDVLGAKIPGVNTAYLYLGMWKATFAWHLEDVDLYSINYLHFGAPKQWYSIAQGDARRFEAAMKSVWPTDAKACDQFLRHKSFLISPAHLLANYNIKVNKIVHHPGEFVITFPYGYHSGYNLGYNCAEAVNFGLHSWLEYGRVAKKCECALAQESVWIDVHALERKLRGEETEYEESDEEEEEDDEEDESNPTNIPTPPQSSGDAKIKVPQKKRKRPTNGTKDNPDAKRIRVRIKAPAREPCILCPNDIPSEPLLRTEEGKEAHRICASYIPETSIASRDNKDIVTDVQYINKARLELKCNYCRSRKGACFQCSSKRCTRAYHATCAAAAGVLVEQGEIPVFGEDGTEYKEWGIEFACRFHRPKRDKKLDSDNLDDEKRILLAALELAPGHVCQAQFYRGDIFAGVVVENRKDEQMIIIDILPRGERFEVEYKWLLIPDPSEYHLPKPSAKAIPMPKSFKDKESLNTSKRQADDIPRAEDPFVQGCTWAEFKCEAIPCNSFQVKIDLSKENQVWYYLGKNSTEARAQFTEDLANPRHNPKGLFLETLPKAVPAPPRQSYAASYPASLSQNALNAARAATKAPQPQATVTPNRPEKPYVYKPRDNNAPYSIDPQAYRSQQSFLQRSTPVYSFGTDPRYRSETPSAAYKISTPTSTVVPPSTGHAPTYQTVPKTVTPSPQSYAPPKPAHTSAQSKPAEPSNNKSANPRPKVSTPKVAYTGPNPFAKYTYLQKEHNRSPWDYKSPYRPGGGFMNGYQGDITKAALHMYSRERSVRPNEASSPAASAVPTPPSTYKADAYKAPSPASSSVPKPEPSASPRTQWEQKDRSALHPAIRPEYSTMFHNKYQPQPSPQYRGLMQPPAMYDRAAAPLPPGQQTPLYQSPQTSTNHQGPALQPSHPSTQNMAPPTPQYSPSPAYHYQQSAQASPHPQQSPNPQATYSSPSMTQPSPYHSSQAYQPPPAQYQENNGLYPHQQYFQKSAIQPPVQPQTQFPGYPQGMQSAAQTYHSHGQPQSHQLHAMQQPGVQFSQARSFPDVPADSTSLVESMLANLRKAARTTAPAS